MAEDRIERIKSTLRRMTVENGCTKEEALRAKEKFYELVGHNTMEAKRFALLDNILDDLIHQYLSLSNEKVSKSQKEVLHEELWLMLDFGDWRKIGKKLDEEVN